MLKGFEKILEKHDLKKTKPRISVLEILAERKSATSQPDLEQVLGKDVDRVTLYRVLKTFEEKGIIHKIIDLNGTANYAVCSSSCTEHQHHDQHVHFNCRVCLQIYCLDSVHVPQLQLPSGFTPDTVNHIVYGTCPGCNEKHLQA
ncbi:Fur family transcriptional regulator [Desertivirga xinjiangensis]|uniref:Fur family transcriptional regulator n=1 Tax=Desertivirga xinjiangensis TaxID=539206 RepID=UPI002109EBA8|nr:transcriptional repressor [Pedobacter xinjiangensis]